MINSKIKKNIKTKQDSIFHVNTDSKGNVITKEIETVCRINNDCMLRLAGKIQDRSRVEVIEPEGLYETSNIDNIGVNEYYVNYDYGLLIFNEKRIGQQCIVKCKCVGETLLSDSKIFTEINNNGDVVETLHDIIERNEQFFMIVKDSNELAELNEQIKIAIKNGNTVKQQLSSEIVKGTNVDTKLVKNINIANQSNQTLLSTISQANSTKYKLDSSTSEAERTDSKLKSTIQDSLKKKGELVDVIEAAETKKNALNGTISNATNKNNILNSTITTATQIKESLDRSISSGNLANYVKRETGKGLSTNDFDNKYKKMLDDMKKNVVDWLYPVGSIFISTNTDNPNRTMGGTWEAFAQGRTLVGVDGGQTEFNSAQKIGGEKTHKLTIAEMPKHNHSIHTQHGASGFGSDLAFTRGSSGSGNKDWTSLGNEDYVKYQGSDSPHNNLQPYITVYMWKRIA